ncbi:hypothetical protein FNB79_00225 [Formosa sediminum]|uniref:TonB-dependent receptor plug domain-containing protein n=1 Tax=Formosa sediminum TaxID=2594004 RepID=A0A516GLT3_9FLAO|nr:TonB-dependent receptor plug domain-containing protein [Formosa sediminum]QDO92477.1 hypothetical protein FNB79_00225 [Formosa sediminum]
MSIQSKFTQITKFTIIAPLLSIALMSFTPKKMYNSQECNNAMLTQSESEVTAIVTKAATNEQLERLVSMFASQNVTLKFKHVKRDASQNIIAISVSAQYEGKDLKYKTDANKPISPIKIALNLSTNQIQLEKFEGNKHLYIVKTNNTSESKTTTIIVKSENSNSESIVEFDQDNKLISLTTDGETKELDKKGDVIAWTTETEYTAASQNTPKNKPLVFVDGEKKSQAELENIDPNSIEKMNVLKGEKAIAKYGESAKDGAIEITLK